MRSGQSSSTAAVRRRRAYPGAAMAVTLLLSTVACGSGSDGRSAEVCIDGTLKYEAPDADAGPDKPVTTSVARNANWEL